MPKPKGTRDKSTIERQKNAAALLAVAKEEQTALMAELREHEETLEKEQKAVSEIRTKLRYYKGRIVQLEKDAAEQAERERQEIELAEVEKVVQQLITQGMTAEEILEKIQ